jgi:hypothetical protein
MGSRFFAKMAQGQALVPINSRCIGSIKHSGGLYRNAAP